MTDPIIVSMTVVADTAQQATLVAEVLARTTVGLALDGIPAAIEVRQVEMHDCEVDQ